MRSIVVSSPIHHFRFLFFKIYCRQFSVPQQAILESSPPEKSISEPEIPRKCTNSKTSDFIQSFVFVQPLLTHRNDPDSAYKYFQQVTEQDPKSDTLFVLLHILANSTTHFHKARRLLDSNAKSDSSRYEDVTFDGLVDCAKRFDFELNPRVFNYLLHSNVRAGRFKDALDCYDSMVKCDMMPWIFIINRFLSALLKKNMFGEMRDLYADIVSRGINCYDSTSVHLMMTACVKEGKLQEAGKYFAEAKMSGVKLDRVLYGLRICIACKEQNLSCGLELLDEMKNRGWVPPKSTYTDLILTCVKKMNMVEALRLKSEMFSNGHAMNLVIATSLMEGYTVLGDLPKALGLFEELSEYGIAVNNVKVADIKPAAYVIISSIQGFLTDGLLEQATKLIDEAVDARRANIFIYNTILVWFCYRGRVNEAQNIWDKMVDKGVVPTLVSYNNMILGYCRKGYMDRALAFFSQLQKENLRANAITFSILIDGYLRKGENDEALNMFEQMEKSGVAPTGFTFDMLINGVCKLGRMSEAKDILKYMVSIGLLPTCMTYNSIIDGFVKEGAIYSAMAVYGEMLDRGISPDAATYTSLIDGFCKSKNS